MPITDHDVTRIARLAALALSPEQKQRAQHELDQIMLLIEQLQAVDTQGVEPMAHPLSAHQDISLRLRDDQAAPTLSEARRDANMANAPARTEGLFLVPTVIE